LIATVYNSKTLLPWWTGLYLECSGRGCNGGVQGQSPGVGLGVKPPEAIGTV